MDNPTPTIETEIAELDNEPVETKPTRRRRAAVASLPSNGGVKIKQVAEWIESKPNEEIEVDDEENEDEVSAFANRINRARLHNRRQIETPIATLNAPIDRLARMFSQLAEMSETDGEMFYCFITRRADFLQDRFHVRANATMNFAPMPITTRSALEFVPMLQEANGNSGGRFDVRVTDEAGNDLNIGVAGLVINNPVLPPSPPETTKPESSENTMMMQIFEQMREERIASENRFADLLETISQPKEDEFTRLAREKLRQDILNPREAKTFNSEELITQIFTSQAIIERLSNKFADAFGGSSKDQSTLDKILNNEMLMNLISDRAADAMAMLESLVIARNGGQLPAPNTTPDAATVTAAQNEAMEVIDKIINGLESDEPISNENSVLVELEKTHSQMLGQLKMLIPTMPFETVLDNLEQLSPEVFKQFYDGEELNERGQKMESRLKELYVLFGGKVEA